MKIELISLSGYSVVKVEGRLDTVSAPDFEKKVRAWIDEGTSALIVDFTDLEYISSAGLRVLLVAAKSAKAAGGKLSCCSLKGVVRKVFEVSGFSTMLPVYESLESAVGQS